MMLRSVVVWLLVIGIAGCTTVLSSPGADTSRAWEPPGEWESAVAFEFVDREVLAEYPELGPGADYQAQISFNGASGIRRVTGRDVVFGGNTGVRTPWYRLRNPDGDTVQVSITLEHSAGGTTVAVFPLVVSRGEYSHVSFGIGRRASATMNPLPEVRGYPVNVSADASPGDSLWVYRFRIPRSCVDCPR